MKLKTSFRMSENQFKQIRMSKEQIKSSILMAFAISFANEIVNKYSDNFKFYTDKEGNMFGEIKLFINGKEHFLTSKKALFILKNKQSVIQFLKTQIIEIIRKTLKHAEPYLDEDVLVWESSVDVEFEDKPDKDVDEEDTNKEEKIKTRRRRMT